MWNWFSITSPSTISEELFENVFNIKQLCVDISFLCCVDAAQILSTSFETGRRLDAATPNDKTNSLVETFQTQFDISNVRANHLSLHITWVATNVLADEELQRRKNQRGITMESLIDHCAHGCVEFGPVFSSQSQLQVSLDFHLKKNDRIFELAETLLSTGNFEEAGLEIIEASVYCSTMTSATLRVPSMKKFSFFRWMESIDLRVQTELKLDQKQKLNCSHFETALNKK